MEASPRLDALTTCIIDLYEHKAQICAALEYTNGTHSFDDIATLVLTGRCTLWTEGESFVITELFETPQRRSLHVFPAGGNRSDLTAIHPRCIKYARERKCTMVTISGRAGWLRILAHLGWKEAFRTLELDLAERLPYEFPEDEPELDFGKG